MAKNGLTEADRNAAITEASSGVPGGSDFRIEAESYDQPVGPFLRVDYKKENGKSDYEWVHFINGKPVKSATRRRMPI
jgi:hypothetical protein